MFNPEAMPETTPENVKKAEELKLPKTSDEHIAPLESEAMLETTPEKAPENISRRDFLKKGLGLLGGAMLLSPKLNMAETSPQKEILTKAKIIDDIGQATEYCENIVGIMEQEEKMIDIKYGHYNYLDQEIKKYKEIVKSLIKVFKDKKSSLDKTEQSIEQFKLDVEVNEAYDTAKPIIDKDREEIQKLILDKEGIIIEIDKKILAHEKVNIKEQKNKEDVMKNMRNTIFKQ